MFSGDLIEVDLELQVSCILETTFSAIIETDINTTLDLNLDRDITKSIFWEMEL